MTNGSSIAKPTAEALVHDAATFGVAIAGLARQKGFTRRKIRDTIKALLSRGITAEQITKEYGFAKQTVSDAVNAPNDDGDCFFGRLVSKPTKANPHPDSLVERDRDFLGGIDLDPFSRRDANDNWIKATNYYGRDNGKDGFDEPWLGRCSVNPSWQAEAIVGAISKFLEENRTNGANGILHIPIYPDSPYLIPLAESGCVTICQLHMKCGYYQRLSDKANLRSDLGVFTAPDGTRYRVTDGAGALKAAHCLISSDPAEHVRFRNAYKGLGLFVG